MKHSITYNNNITITKEDNTIKMQCNETDALLQVKYNITKEEWDNSRPKSKFHWKGAFLKLQDQGNTVDDERFANFTCLPRVVCSVAVGAVSLPMRTIFRSTVLALLRDCRLQAIVGEPISK